MAQLSCTANFIEKYLNFGFSSQCQVVQQVCPDQDGYIFLELYYCQMNHSTLMLLVLTAVIVFIAFNLLSSTAENYLSPAVTNISETLGLSETVAGVTLVAMGNGAPDCLVAISAAQGSGDDDEGDGISFTIGSIFGAGLFVCTMCVSLVIEKAGGQIQPNKIMFTRDLVFYLIASSSILVFGIIGKITLGMALGFMGIYVLYIVIVIVLEMKQNKNEQETELQEKLKTEDGQDIKIRDLNTQDDQEQDDQMTKIDNQKEKIQSINNDQSSDDEINNIPNKQPFQLEIKENHYDHVPEQQTEQQTIQNYKSSEQKVKRFQRTRHQIKNKILQAQQQWSEMEFFDKITYIWEIPADFIRDITIPPAQENWNKYRAIISIILGPSFFLISGILPEDLVNPFEDWWILVVLASTGILFSPIVWKTTHTKIAPSYCWIFSTMAFMISIAWMNIIADYLIEFLSFIQIITQINQVFLGMTFLAIGNSLADYFTNGQLSSLGFGNMAITACYSGQLFNLLVGFGLSLVISTLKKPLDFDLFGQKSQLNFSDTIGNSLGYILVICSIINVSFLIIYSFSQKFKYGKNLVNILRIIYIVLILGCMVIGIISDLSAPEFEL